jgi:hypothetical protein
MTLILYLRTGMFYSLEVPNGDDTIIGNGGSFGIFNGGTINTGRGNDVVDALTGGFSGTGTINLGKGNDVVKGFGTGFFDGDSGIDILHLGAGTYTVSATANSAGFYTLGNGITDMLLKNFEFFDNAINPTAPFSFSSVIGETFTI